MTDHDDILYLSHIDEAASRIERSAERRGRDALSTGEDLRDATVFRLQTLAESTQRLSFQFKSAHPEIPWDDNAGLRNRLVHGYLDVDFDIVWDVVVSDLPPLARLVREEIDLR
ncbi:MAG: uncharacterized protein JWO62_138 [Acidimicrobiaceae bacterium]|nr:uncharacterized protein [Acidimicrobiaceae bacterium]